MKKSLLLAALATIASLSWAEQKTAVFNFQDPNHYGYATPNADKTDTPLEVGSTLTEEDVVVSVVANGNTPCRFWYTANGIQLRLASGCSIGITAGGEPIKSISLTGNNIEPNKNFTSDANGWSYNSGEKIASWTGSTESINITQASSTVQLVSLTVVYGEDGGGQGGDKPQVESYTAIDANGIADVFANATSDGAKSIVTFGTENMAVEAVGGRTPKDVKIGPQDSFEGWTRGWNEPTWAPKSQNLCDRKPGVDTLFFYYINGTGNPAVAIDAEEPIPSKDDDSLICKPKYTFYEPDGSLGLPMMGLYYRFTPKVAGALKVQVWSNKGNRNTFFVKESTKQPIKYRCEGYINGQNETRNNVVMKASNGADSIGSMNYMRYLSQEVIDSIHHRAKTVYTYDTIWNETHDVIVEINKQDSTDSAPYVIGNGIQNFWGWLTIDVEAGDSYWLFQHSSQIGFSGYEFTIGGSAGIENLAAATQSPADRRTYDITGRAVQAIKPNQLYLRGGKKIIIR